MKAIIFPARGEVTCASLPDPVAGNGEVVIAVKASGLCHTDFEVLKADCVEKLRNQSVADFLRKPMKRNSRKALTTRQRMAARERM